MHTIGSLLLVPIPVVFLQISDDTNQAKGFAVVGTCGGVARLLVSGTPHSTLCIHGVSYCSDSIIIIIIIKYGVLYCRVQ